MQFETLKEDVISSLNHKINIGTFQNFVFKRIKN